MHDEQVTVEKNTAQNLELSIDLTCPLEVTPLYTAQVELEKEMRSLAIDKFLQDQKKLINSNSASDSAIYSRLRRDEIARIVHDMQSNKILVDAEAADTHTEGSPALLSVIERMESIVGFEAMALIGFNETVNCLSVGRSNNPFEDLLVSNIAEAIDHQAFLSYIQNIDEALLAIISKYCLNDKTKKRNKRIKASIEYADRFEHVDWDWLSDEDKQRIGGWVKDRVFHGTGLFESMPSFNPATGKVRYVVMLTEKGEQMVKQIEDEACNRVGSSFPMIHAPRDWGRNTVGGYLTVQPGNRSHLIHNYAGTLISDTAIQALNNLQSVPWVVNKFIYDVQVKLLNTTQEIGSFRSFDSETYKLQNPLIENPEVAEMSWDDAKEDPELLKKKKKAYGIMKRAEQEEKTVAQKAIATRRAIDMATRFLNEEHLYMPWYFDNRGRAYCLVDTLNPQASDNVKALIKFAEGVPKSDESYRDILISLATTYGHGLDKLPYEGRIEAAKKMVPLFKAIAKNPLSETAFSFWTKAEEPFQFLALAEEYYQVFIMNQQDMHYVSSGRDATCSGIQIAGALLRDAKTCHLVNVTPSDTVQDAYRAVAEEAIKLINDERWMSEQIEKRETGRAKKAESIRRQEVERRKQGLPVLREYKYEPRYECNIQTDLVDRSVAKMVVMLTPYGGSYQTMFEHVKTKMEKKGATMHQADYTILTHALVQGMANALPGFSALNQWFKNLAKAVLEKGEKQIRWVTPAGSLVKQEYFDTEESTIKTFSYGETKVNRYYTKRERTTKKIKERKMQTALAANTVHSLDAALLQLAIANFSDTPFTTVHDCVYGPSGTLRQLVEHIKDAFYEVVSGNFLYEMLEENELEDNDELICQLRTMTHSNDGLLESIKDSEYLFS
jgi:DNA-directed RNA polymerase